MITKKPNRIQYNLGKNRSVEFQELSYVRKDLPMEKELPKVMIQRADTDKCALILQFHIHTEKERSGWAHLLEHCMFGNVYQGKTLTELITWLYSKGININGSTGVGHMTFEFECRLRDIRYIQHRKGLVWDAWKDTLEQELAYDWKLFLSLIENVLYHIPTEEDFERERKIVLSEIAPDEWKTVWGNRIRNMMLEEQDILPAGYVSTVEKATYQDILALSNILKDPANIANMQIVVPKHISEHKIDDLCRVVGHLTDHGVQKEFTKRMRDLVTTCSTPLHLLPVKKEFPYKSLHVCAHNNCTPEDADKVNYIMMLPEITIPHTSDIGALEEGMLLEWTHIITVRILMNKIQHWFRDKKHITYGVRMGVPACINHKNSNGSERIYLSWDVLPEKTFQDYSGFWSAFKREESKKKYEVTIEEVKEDMDQYMNYWVIPLLRGKLPLASVRDEFLYEGFATTWRDLDSLDVLIRNNYSHPYINMKIERVRDVIQEMYEYIMKNSPVVLVCQKDGEESR